MADNPFTQPHSPDYEAIAKSTPEILGGARWFWWIAGLSLINTIVMHVGGNMSFLLGLGFTLVMDGIFQNLKVVAFGLDLVALGFFFAMGWFAAKGRLWAFITGIVLYTLDAGIYVLFQDWMPAAFHGLALFYLVRAALRLRELGKAAAAPFAPPPAAS